MQSIAEAGIKTVLTAHVAVFYWKKGILKMKNETKHNVKRAFETLALGVVCSVWVLSMHQSCSGVAERLSDKKSETSKIQKVQELKNDTINTFKLEQRVR